MLRSRLISEDFFPQECSLLIADYMCGSLSGEDYLARRQKLDEDARRQGIRDDLERVLSGGCADAPAPVLLLATDIDQKWLPLFISFGCSESHAKRALELR